MGVEYSTFNILGSSLDEEISTETDGNRKVVTKKRNPWVTGVVITSATLLCMTYLDGGKGMVSKTFGKVCLNCNSKLKI
jgi:hypothetical protein